VKYGIDLINIDDIYKDIWDLIHKILIKSQCSNYFPNTLPLNVELNVEWIPPNMGPYLSSI
jgi:hypothetical protein